MNLSLGEFRSLVAKAFRGVGYSWGLTDDAAFAAGQLAASGLPAGEMVLRLLRHADGRARKELMPDADWDGATPGWCGVCVGVSLADLGSWDGLAVGSVMEPAFIAPMLDASASIASGGAFVEWDGGRYEVVDRVIRLVGAAPDGAVDVAIRQGGASRAGIERRHRVSLDAQQWAELTALAERTYAPATEASRAGAGPTV